MKKKQVYGIAVLNPVDVEENYLNYTIDYAIKNKYNHLQIVGPIHNPVKGNIDGMTEYKKYSQFNNAKDMEYVKYCQTVLNKSLEKTAQNGIKTYMWHHELELPVGFNEAFPEALNSFGDIEVTAPVVKDYLENKIKDFFDQYPLFDGIVLTLHETRVPLLKLQNQKLDKIGRVKYVTEILYDACKARGKELIVRPFASILEDYDMMTKAYEEISRELVIFDKWTQFDWSLTLPHNQFFNRIKKNPLLVETDIFGEYFGKGRLPLMLYDHIKAKYAYCESFKSLRGYCSRIDRGGRDPFNQVNEVNLVIMNAFEKGLNVDEEVDKFFNDKYGEYGPIIKKIMSRTEEALTKTIYLKGFYFSELSYVPTLNHAKNHFYFEMMKKNYKIASNEWFIPIGWERGTLESVYEEKDSAVEITGEMLKELMSLEGKLNVDEYIKLYKQFLNLYYIARVWRQMLEIFRSYIAYFDERNPEYKNSLDKAFIEITQLFDEGNKKLGKDFYCGNRDIHSTSILSNYVETLVNSVKESFEAENKLYFNLLDDKTNKDFIICGGATESHSLQKEVNFSDTGVNDGELFRVPGTNMGKAWSQVNAHGWFSYELSVTPNTLNKIEIVVDNEEGVIDYRITIDGKLTTVTENKKGKAKFTFEYKANDNDKVRVRIDRNSSYTPRIYTIIVK